MYSKVAPKPLSPPLPSAKPLEPPHFLGTREPIRSLFNWQIPLPSSAPQSRSQTTDSAGSLIGTDIMGPDDLAVMVRPLQRDEGFSEGGGGGGDDGLRRRGIATSSGVPAAAPKTQRLYQGRKSSKLNKNAGGGASARGKFISASPEHTLGHVTTIEDDGLASECTGELVLDSDANGLQELLKGLGLEHVFPALASEALGSLKLLKAMAASDEDSVRKALKEAGVDKVGHREAIVLALTTANTGGFQSEQAPGRARILGVKDEGIRAALANLAVTSFE